MISRPADRRTRRLMIVLPLAGLLGAFLFSSAYFSDEGVTNVAQLEAGTIEISATGSGTWVGNYDNLLPGAVVTTDVNVLNAGSAALVYSISADADATPAEFAAAVGVKIYVGACSGVDFATATPLADGTLDSLSGVILGDPAPYAQAGDRYLDAGADEDLCLRVQFVNDETPQDTLQGATADLTLTFQATQIDADGSVATPEP